MKNDMGGEFEILDYTQGEIPLGLRMRAIGLPADNGIAAPARQGIQMLPVSPPSAKA